MVPRIKADNIADHVAQQRAAVLDAAVRLFIERGYGEVGLADIAAEVGLARNSIYRYVPDKAHLLVEWFQATIPRIIESWEASVAGDDPPELKLERWARTYLSWARSPEHQLVSPLTDALAGLDDATRADVAQLHRSMMDVVARVVAEAGTPADQVQGSVDLLAGLVLGAARAESASGAEDPAVRRRLDAAVAAVITA
jgi:AcrR family transcriptional regulator